MCRNDTFGRIYNPPLRCIEYFFNGPNYLIRHGIEFVIRALTNPSISGTIATLSGSDWQPLRHKDGSLSQHQWVARCAYAMYRSNKVFDLVIQRTLRPLPPRKKWLSSCCVGNGYWTPLLMTPFSMSIV